MRKFFSVLPRSVLISRLFYIKLQFFNSFFSHSGCTTSSFHVSPVIGEGNQLLNTVYSYIRMIWDFEEL